VHHARNDKRNAAVNRCVYGAHNGNEKFTEDELVSGQVALCEVLLAQVIDCQFLPYLNVNLTETLHLEWSLYGFLESCRVVYCCWLVLELVMFGRP